MKRYLLVLGRANELAFAELSAVLSRNQLPSEKLTRFDHLAILATTAKIDPARLMQSLGGTTKIIGLTSPARSTNFLDRILAILRNESIGRTKLVFGVSLIGHRDRNQQFLLPKTLKEQLDNEGIACRYILAREGSELSSAQVRLLDLTELYVVWRDSLIEIGRTIAVQDFQGFAKRDYGRPYVNPREGMLPPKVAKMMVNLGLPRKITSETTILDPFCGTGTIAMEALLLGAHVIASDIKKEKVQGTRRNLEWLAKAESFNARWQVFQSDATKIGNLLPKKVDAIISEPYLGPPKIQETKLADTLRGLNRLYLGALKHWRQCLKRNGRVVLVLPEFHLGQIVKRADLIIDRCENLGYTLVAGPYPYDRPQATVARLIWVLEKR